MECCHCQGIEQTFADEYIRDKLDRYRREGPNKSTERLLAAITPRLNDADTLLDIGGGVGAIQHRLLAAGVTRAINMEASTAAIAACQAEAARLGHAERIDHHHGNFVDLAPTLPDADIVTLDRVLCCYPDMPALVCASAAKARRLYAVVFPRDTWYARLGARFVLNAVFFLQRNPFRVFVHPTEAVVTQAAAAGLRLTRHETAGIWQVLLFERGAAAA